MQKKILASLLMVPMAYSAFANIQVEVPVTVDNWKFDGVQGDVGYNAETGTFETYNVGVGYVSQDLDLPQGSYTLTFASTTNATISVNGKALTATDGKYTFDVAANAGKTNLMIAAANPAQTFSFTGLNLEVVCDFDAIAGELGDSIKDMNLDQVVEADKSDVAEALRKQATDLSNKLDAIKERVDALKDPANQNLDTYKKEDLANHPNAIESDLAALQQEVDEYNEAVKAENERFANEQLNATNQEALAGNVQGLENKLAQIKAKIDANVAATGNDYVETSTLGDYNSVSQSIDGLAAQVEALKEDPNYNGKEVIDVAGLRTTVEEISTALDALDSDVDQAIADLDAYLTAMQLNNELKAAYEAAATRLSGLQGIEGYETVPYFYVSEMQTAIANTYNSTLDNLKIKKDAIKGAAADLAADKALIEATIPTFKNTADVAEQKVNTQNNYMTADLEDIASLQSRLDAINTALATMPAGPNKTKVEDSVAAIAPAIADVKSTVEAEYGKLALQPADLSANLKAINNDLKTIEKYLQPIIDLQKKLDDAKATINNEYPEIADKFKTTIDNIQAGINALDPSTEDIVEAAKPVSAGIDELLANAAALDAAYQAVNAANNAYASELQGINNLLTNKIILEGNTSLENFAATNTAYKNFKADVDAYKAAFDAAMALESQACYDALTKLAEQYNADLVAEDAAAINKNIDTIGTNGNFGVVNGDVNDLKAAAQGTYVGQADVLAEIATIENKIAQLNTQFEAAQTGDYAHKNFNAVDVELQKLVAQIDALENTIALYKEYQAIYDSFDVDHLKSDLQKAVECNNENATAPAQAYWKGVIAADSAEVVAFENKLNAALAAYKDSKNNIKAQKAALETAYQTLDLKLENLPIEIVANETAHNALLGTSQNIRDFINAGLDTINAQKAQSAAVDEIAQKLNEWSTALEALLDKHVATEEENYGNLAAEDNKVYNSFAKGENAKNKATFDAEYDAIKAAAESILADFNNEFGKLVADYNNSLIANGTPWDAALKLLDLDYQKAVTTYNKYMYGLHNEGYKAFIEETLKDHRGIYNYIDSINDLQAAVREYVAAQNAANHIISAAEWQANATDKADAIADSMAGDVAAMQTAVDTKAKEYYAQQDAAATAAIAAATTKLHEVYVSEDLIEKYLGANVKALNEAEADYAKTDSTDVLGQMGLEMDNIADLLDEALNIKPAMFDQAAAEQWKNDIAAAEEQLNLLEARIVQAAFATDEVLEEQKAIFDAAKDAILNTLKPETAEYNTLIGLEDALQDQLAKAKEAADAIKASSDSNKANQEVYNKYIADIAGLTNDLDALKAFVDGLAAGTDATLAAPEAALDALKNYVENNKGNLINNKDNVDNLVNAFNNAVENAYGATATAEQALLNEWYGKLKAAYNDANVNSTTLTPEEKEAYKAQVDAIELPAVWTPNTDNTEWMADAVAAEKAITSLYNELQSSWTEDKNGNPNPNQNPLADALTKVDEAADQAGINLNEFENALNGYEEGVQNEYNDKLQDYANQYQALKDAVQAQGANIILTADRYINDFNELAEAIQATAKEAADAQQAALDKAAQEAASDAAYAKLLDEYNNLEDAFNTLKETVAGYGENVENAMEDTLDGIEAQLEAAKAALDAAKEAYSLTDESTLENAEAIENAIIAAGTAAAKAYAAEAYNDAVAAKQAYLNAMTTMNVVPEIATELATEYHNANQDLSNALAAFNELGANATSADYLNIHALYGEIEAQFKDMLKKAQDNTFVKGDVNLNPDGEVNGNDVQLLIKWVGEGMTYAELYEISPAVAAAADLNGDKVLNIADVTAEINLVMNADYAEAPALLRRGVAADNGTIALSFISSENGISRYALNINSARQFVAGQFDIKGAEIVGAELAGMSHDLYQFDNNNATRFIIASFENAALATDNAVMIIEVKGDATPVIEGATFADVNASAYALQDATQNGIDGINAASTVSERIYNAAGQTMRAIQRGINIIRHSDGTTTKELHK